MEQYKRSERAPLYSVQTYIRAYNPHVVHRHKRADIHKHIRRFLVPLNPLKWDLTVFNVKKLPLTLDHLKFALSRRQYRESTSFSCQFFSFFFFFQLVLVVVVVVLSPFVDTQSKQRKNRTKISKIGVPLFFSSFLSFLFFLLYCLLLRAFEAFVYVSSFPFQGLPDLIPDQQTI